MLAKKMKFSVGQSEVMEPVYMALAQNAERRAHRRHDLEHLNLVVERWDAMRQTGTALGMIVDLSATGIRFKTKNTDLKADSHVRIRLTLPAYAGISPFIDLTDGMKPKGDWVGWLVVSRVEKHNGEITVAGRLVDMDEMDRGMLGLYLSTQPLAA